METNCFICSEEHYKLLSTCKNLSKEDLLSLSSCFNSVFLNNVSVA